MFQYDTLASPSSPGHLSDKQCAIDLVIIRDAVKRAGLTMRWAPSALQLADALTKASADCADTLRGVLRRGQYQLRSEEEALRRRAEEMLVIEDGETQAVYAAR